MLIEELMHALMQFHRNVPFKLNQSITLRNYPAYLLSQMEYFIVSCTQK